MEQGHVLAGRYRLRERLGSGGMSVVWRADDDVLGRAVAIKVLAPALAGDPELRQRIRAEARAVAGLRHAGIVDVYDYGEFTESGQALSYVVMELIDGRSLDDMLTGDPLPWRLAVLIGAQVAAALAAAHRHGIVHRDVKPANVMVTANGVKLVDFGISAAVGEMDGRNGLVLGTPAYLAPERIKGAPVRPATDVYALGLLLYRALAGRMPWTAETVTQMVKAHVYASPSSLPATPGLPVEVTRLVTRCLAKQPADRPSSAELAEMLGAIAGLPSSTFMRTAAEPTLALPRRRIRRPRRVLLAGAATVLVALGASWWAWDAESSPQQAAAAAPVCTVADGSCPSRAEQSSPTPAPRTDSSPSSPRVTTRPVVDRPAKPHVAAPAGPAAKKPKPGPAAKPGPKAPKPKKKKSH